MDRDMSLRFLEKLRKRSLNPTKGLEVPSEIVEAKKNAETTKESEKEAKGKKSTAKLLNELMALPEETFLTKVNDNLSYGTTFQSAMHQRFVELSKQNKSTQAECAKLTKAYESEKAFHSLLKKEHERAKEEIRNLRISLGEKNKEILELYSRQMEKDDVIESLTREATYAGMAGALVGRRFEMRSRGLSEAEAQGVTISIEMLEKVNEELDFYINYLVEKAECAEANKETLDESNEDDKPNRVTVGESSEDDEPNKETVDESKEDDEPNKETSDEDSIDVGTPKEGNEEVTSPTASPTSQSNQDVYKALKEAGPSTPSFEALQAVVRAKKQRHGKALTTFHSKSSEGSNSSLCISPRSSGSHENSSKRQKKC